MNKKKFMIGALQAIQGSPHESAEVLRDWAAKALERIGVPLETTDQVQESRRQTEEANRPRFLRTSEFY